MTPSDDLSTLKMVRADIKRVLLHCEGIADYFWVAELNNSYKALDAIIARMEQNTGRESGCGSASARDEEKPSHIDRIAGENPAAPATKDAAGSSNGRTADFESANLGSSPSPASCRYGIQDGVKARTPQPPQ